MSTHDSSGSTGEVSITGPAERPVKRWTLAHAAQEWRPGTPCPSCAKTTGGRIGKGPLGEWLACEHCGWSTCGGRAGVPPSEDASDVPSEAPQARSEAPLLCPSCGCDPNEEPTPGSNGPHWRDCVTNHEGEGAQQCEGRRRDGARCTLVAGDHKEHRCVRQVDGKREVVSWRGRTAKGKAPDAPVIAAPTDEKSWGCHAHCVRGEGVAKCSGSRVPRPSERVSALLMEARADVERLRGELGAAAASGAARDLPGLAFRVEQAEAQVDMMERECAHALHAEASVKRELADLRNGKDPGPLTTRDGAADALALREELAELEERAKAAAERVRAKWGDLSFPSHHAEDIGAALSLALHNLEQLDEWVRKHAGGAR